MDKNILQLIDANLNRAREGLRVCEDIARFYLRSKASSSLLKTLRHKTTNVALESDNISLKRLICARDTKHDLSKFVDFNTKNRSVPDIFMSNIERAKESLRVLEECCKIIDEASSIKYRKLRFDAYETEKILLKKVLRKVI